MYKYKINFELNSHQKECSAKIVKYFRKNKDILLEAVCGAGKTEMLLEVIKVALNQGYNVGFACPRKQLLFDLYNRINSYFNHYNIGLITSDSRINIDSNLIFLTTHQLYKYKNYFDLLIIDEIDAFPFCDDVELESRAQEAAKQFIYLSATVPAKYYKQVIQKNLVLVNNYKRHHLKKMPIVKVEIANNSLILKLISRLNIMKNKLIIIYVPTKKVGKKLQVILRILNFKTKFVCSDNLNKDILCSFNNKEFNIMISTTVLERGVTFKDVNVIVFQANHNVFTQSTLIQICGRVGRDSLIYYGEIFFITKKENEAIQNCDLTIKRYNAKM